MKKTILIVEDNQLNSELFTDLLEINDFIVSHASNAEDGIQSARSQRPDLILMDISLPGMDGLCAARKLKSEPATRHIPIVALTAHAMKGDAEDALESGCDGYLSKPIDTRSFIASVTSFLHPAAPKPD